MQNPALVSRKIYKQELGEKNELSDADLLGANFSAVIIEEVWNATHPDCPFSALGDSKKGAL